MKILIIEDEPWTAMDLKEMLHEISEQCEVLAIVPSIKSALKFIEEYKGELDLIFSDIELQDGRSFDFFSQYTPPCPVVFCTAYDEFALLAFKNNAIDYVLKPFSKKDIEASLTKIQLFKDAFNQGNPSFTQLDAEYGRGNKNLLVHYQGRIIPIKQSEVDFFYKENELTYLYTQDSRKYILDRTLDSLETELGDEFFRVNRQAIIQRTAVREWSQLFNRKLELVTFRDHGVRLDVSRNKVNAFIQWMKGK